MKTVLLEEDSWDLRNKEFNKDVIRVATKDRLPASMQDELEDNHEDYHSIPIEERCELLSTMKVKYNRKRVLYQIKRLANSNS